MKRPVLYNRAATYDNMMHKHCMLDTQDYKHTLRLCNNYCFPTATLVARTRLSVIFYTYIHSLSCFLSVSVQQMVRAALRPVAAGTNSRALNAKGKDDTRYFVCCVVRTEISSLCENIS
jgi:hypothetical protein